MGEQESGSVYEYARRPPCQNSVMIASPRQCAAALIRSPSGQVLMVRQAYGKRFWGLPGGIVDPGETPLQAAIRESREEIGVEVELEGVVGLYRLQGGGWPDIQAYVFWARIRTGEPHIVNTGEIEALEWRDLDDLPAPLLPDVDAALQDVRSGKIGVVREVRRKIEMGSQPI